MVTCLGDEEGKIETLHGYSNAEQWDKSRNRAALSILCMAMILN